MRIKLIFLVIIGAMIFGCVEDAFEDDSSVGSQGAIPTGLTYPEVLAREFGTVISGRPTYNSFGLVPRFEVVGVKKSDGEALDASILDLISVSDTSLVTTPIAEEWWRVDKNGDTIKSVSVVSFNDVGVISIAENDQFSYGDYTFSVRMTTENNKGEIFEETFDDVLTTRFGPKLASGMIYIPAGQNLLVGSGDKTSEPLVFGANPDFRFELGDNQDKLSIDPATGEISLVNGYVPATEPELITPIINIVSNISEEIVSFTGVGTVYASNAPVVIPKATVQVFYPTLEAINTQFGYRVEIVEPGMAPKVWGQSNPNIATAADRPDANTSQKPIEVNFVSGGKSSPHESWAIMNSQDLTSYAFGFNLEAKFYTFNRFVEYLSTDGSSPSFIDVYVSTDYVGDFDAATWTIVSDELKSIIYDGASSSYPEANEFMGLPYPGDQNLKGFPNPDNRKDPAKNADGRWVQSRLDLIGYKDFDKVTIAFRVYSNFDAEITFASGSDRGGRHLVSDFHITATEQ